jgi:hypothetical protein
MRIRPMPLRCSAHVAALSGSKSTAQLAELNGGVPEAASGKSTGNIS